MGVRWVGRVDVSSPGRVRFSWSGAGFVADFSGTGLGVILDGSTRLVFQAVVDGARSPVFTATPGAKTYALASNLAKGPHTVELYRQTEGQNGDSEISLFTVYDGALSHAPASPGRSLEVVGDSLSCGYGDLGKDETCSYSIETQSHWDSYGAVAARLVGADVATIAVSGRGVYMNYDGTTTMPVPAYYDRTLASSATPEWAFPMEPDAVIVNLGTNDFAKGRDPGAAFGNAYEQFIARLRTLHPNAYILCAVGPMLSDPGLSKVKAALGVVVDARRKTGDSKIEMLEFPPQTQSDFGCDFHPKVDKHRRMGEQLAAVLESKLGW
jgi:lysophospholipase L1-like esterase